MKKILLLLFLVACSSTVFAQLNITGNVKRIDSTAVVGDTVIVFVDTNVTSPPPFQTRITQTDNAGNYGFQINASPAQGTRIIVRTRNCTGGWVDSGFNYNGNNNVVSNLRVCVVPQAGFEGYVHLGSPNLRPDKGNARVYLIQKCSTNVLTVIDSTDSDTNGYYRFAQYPVILNSCEMVMQAKLLDKSGRYSKYLPMYHFSNTEYRLKWSGGIDVEQSLTTNGVNMLLPEAHNPFGGPCSISGKVVDLTTGGSGGLLGNRILKLTDFNDVPVAYTFSDANGNFTFSNIQFGTYKLFGDSWGRSNPDLTVKLSATNVLVDNVIFEEKDTEFVGRFAVSVASTKRLQKVISVYPNPASDLLHIDGLSKISGEKTISLINAVGKEVYRAVSENISVIPVRNLSQGVYFLKIVSGEEQLIHSIVK